MKINKTFTTDNKYFATKINATRFGNFSKSTNTPTLKYKLELFLSYYSFTIQRYMKFQPGVDTFSATFSNRSQSNWIFIQLNFAALLHYTCQLNEFLFKLGCLAKLPQKNIRKSNCTWDFAGQERRIVLLENKVLAFIYLSIWWRYSLKTIRECPYYKMFPRKFDSALRRNKINPYMAIIAKFDIHHDIRSRLIRCLVSLIRSETLRLTLTGKKAEVEDTLCRRNIFMTLMKASTTDRVTGSTSNTLNDQ